MNKFIAVVIVAGIVFGINYVNPTLGDHKSAISPTFAVESKNWDDLEYKDYYVASFTNSVDKKTMVSFGFLKYVNVVDKKWVPLSE